MQPVAPPAHDTYYQGVHFYFNNAKGVTFKGKKRTADGQISTIAGNLAAHPAKFVYF